MSFIVEQQALIVSNPPHGAVDFHRAAPCFGFTAAEVRVKANYAVPEIWLADEDRASLEAAAAELRQCGFDVVVSDVRELADIPGAEPVKALAFTDAGLVAEVERGTVGLAYDLRLVAAFCQIREAPADARRSVGDPMAGRLSHGSMTGSGLMGAVEHQRHGANTAGAMFVDLYATQSGGVRHLTVDRDTRGLANPGGTPLSALTGFLTECASRFSAARVDRRMADMRVRQRSMVGAGSAESRRRGFSYASKGLNQLLESISPSLKELSQAELSSRLVYLTQR